MNVPGYTASLWKQSVCSGLQALCFSLQNTPQCSRDGNKEPIKSLALSSTELQEVGE